ncbi:hypothetical protein T11_1677 [Trichinella zimbabwensis]|uniref:Uncharacterized protein n=1 Tax=Trichinella zimbabwensis TaxID=268475 RepID=A0A0V1H6B5_9BILA|nr:hypothetical protein T11_1677 [Trichinella zimbabwensis]
MVKPLVSIGKCTALRMIHTSTPTGLLFIFLGSVIRVCCLCLPVNYSTLVPLTRHILTSVAKWTDSHKVPREEGQLKVIHVNRVRKRQMRHTQQEKIDICHTEEDITLINYGEIQNQSGIAIPKQTPR